MRLDDLYRHFERVVAFVLMAGMLGIIALALCTLGAIRRAAVSHQPASSTAAR
ncbi:hypothetical protein [Rhodosalinus halophilus]|uniref:hypothetical protein n=1 Tax=Rhodosalinus halophilus TaxID=2259333 RepID=UPI001314513C|nr:hypothetical protein [Rhodosalinus halophilus]